MGRKILVDRSSMCEFPLIEHETWKPNVMTLSSFFLCSDMQKDYHPQDGSSIQKGSDSQPVFFFEICQ